MPQVAVQDGLHHLAQRAALARRGLVRRRPQRLVDLDRQVRAQPLGAGLAAVREGRRRRVPGHRATRRTARRRAACRAARRAARRTGDPPPDAALHRLLADPEGLGQRAQRPARLAKRGQRGRQHLGVPRGTQLAQPGRHALGQPRRLARRQARHPEGRPAGRSPPAHTGAGRGSPPRTWCVPRRPAGPSRGRAAPGQAGTSAAGSWRSFMLIPRPPRTLRPSRPAPRRTARSSSVREAGRQQ